MTVKRFRKEEEEETTTMMRKEDGDAIMIRREDGDIEKENMPTMNKRPMTECFLFRGEEIDLVTHPAITPEAKIVSNRRLYKHYKCKTCHREFTSFQALGGHRASHNKPRLTEEIDGNNNNGQYKEHECSICGEKFAIGQALGGHMRRHRKLTEQPFTPQLSALQALPGTGLAVLPRLSSGTELGLPLLSDSGYESSTSDLSLPEGDDAMEHEESRVDRTFIKFL